MMQYYFLIIILAYLAGSIPFGLLLGYLKGIDIRKKGSGNIGATNVSRVIGKKWGVIVFFLDFLKGFLPLFLFASRDDIPSFILVMLSLAPICGHNWSIFMKFKGGKGVATTLGVVSALSVIFPALVAGVVFALLIWLVVFYTSGYVSLASLTASAGFSLFVFFTNTPYLFKAIVFLFFILILLRHKKNIKSLIKGKELRF